METVGFCEIEPSCRYWLSQNFPGLPIFEDVRTLTGRLVSERCGSVDLLAGGFPCQPVSGAGRRKGTADSRWLWPEMLRLVREVRPRWVLAENVLGLRVRGADRVLNDLEAEGYACWPLVVGARHVGASIPRDRVWILARSDSERVRRVECQAHAVQAGEAAPPIEEWEWVRLNGCPYVSRPRPPRPSNVDQIPGMADGSAGRLDRVASRAIGNSVYAPLVAEIGKAILRADRL
jgi:DNA (cytosine-5)-methyltransferase 1